MFALYTREDAFGLIADSEDELNSWLKSLQIEQRKDQILNASGKLFSGFYFLIHNNLLLCSPFGHNVLFNEILATHDIYKINSIIIYYDS